VDLDSIDGLFAKKGPPDRTLDRIQTLEDHIAALEGQVDAMKEANSSRELENAIELDKTAITM